MIGRFIVFVCDADKAHTITSRVLRWLISVETLNKSFKKHLTKTLDKKEARK